jgi:hypothetical protein
MGLLMQLQTPFSSTLEPDENGLEAACNQQNEREATSECRAWRFLQKASLPVIAAQIDRGAGWDCLAP